LWRVTLVQHEVVAVGIGERRHVADTGVEGVAGEGDASGLKLGARGRNVVDAQGKMAVLLGGELHAEPLWLPDRQACGAGPDLKAGVLVGAQAKRLDVEAA
jgi:hypothetical protein